MTCAKARDDAAAYAGLRPVVEQARSVTIAGALVAVMDDDPAAIEGMRALFTAWGARVAGGVHADAVLEALGSLECYPDLIVATCDSRPAKVDSRRLRDCAKNSGRSPGGGGVRRRQRHGRARCARRRPAAARRNPSMPPPCRRSQPPSLPRLRSLHSISFTVQALRRSARPPRQTVRQVNRAQTWPNSVIAATECPTTAAKRAASTGLRRGRTAASRRQVLDHGGEACGRAVGLRQRFRELADYPADASPPCLIAAVGRSASLTWQRMKVLRSPGIA